MTGNGKNGASVENIKISQSAKTFLLGEQLRLRNQDEDRRKPTLAEIVDAMCASYARGDGLPWDEEAARRERESTEEEPNGVIA